MHHESGYLRPIRCRPGSSAPSASAATSCSPTLPVGAGRIGSNVFLLVAPDPIPSLTGHPDRAAPAAAEERGRRGRVHAARRPARVPAAVGYRLTLERHGLRSKVGVLNPATGAIVATIPDKYPGGLFGGATPQASCSPASARCRRPARRRIFRTRSCCARRRRRSRCATRVVGRGGGRTGRRALLAAFSPPPNSRPGAAGDVDDRAGEPDSGDLLRSPALEGPIPHSAGTRAGRRAA